MISTKELRKAGAPHEQTKAAAAANYLRTAAVVPQELKKFGSYEEMLGHILKKGGYKWDRTGVGSFSVHGYQLRFDMADGFPLVTTKKVYMKAVIYELLWLIKGETNIRYLTQNGVRIWDDWPYAKYRQALEDKGETPLSIKEFAEQVAASEEFAKKWGDLGPVYGKQWRAWAGPDGNHYDQLTDVIKLLKNQYETGMASRRAIVTAWNPAEIRFMSLPACHAFFQFHTMLMSLDERRAYFAETLGKNLSFTEDMEDDELDAQNAPAYKLDLQMYQRSCDSFLGVPFNIASYSLLLMMVARVVNMKAGTFIHDFGDLHIYANHLDQVVLQLSRVPRPYGTMKITDRKQGIEDFKYEDFELLNYKPHPAIEGAVAV